MKLRYFILFIPFFSFLYASENQDYKAFDPWFTGPLNTPSASCLSPGECNFQPYIYYFDFRPKGKHFHIKPDSSDTLSLQMVNFIQYGLLDFLDATLTVNLMYNHKHTVNTFGYGDTNLSFGIQLLRQKENTPIPSIRLCIAENFPTGKYQKLDPDKNAMDAFGSGAFRTSISLNLSKIVYWMKYHPISFRLANSFYVPSLVLVKGFNNYGGGYNTYGKVSPPLAYAGRFSFELSFNQRWAYAMDFEYDYTSKTTFTGIAGTEQDGTPASCSSSSSQLFTIAPALEYSLNENLGFIGGFWFPLYAHNISEFLSFSLSFTYTF